MVVVSLPNPVAVQAALTGPDGLFEGARPGAVVVDTSTISPGASRAMHAAAAERGVAYLDAPGERRRAVPDRGRRGARGDYDLHGRRRRGGLRTRAAGHGCPRASSRFCSGPPARGSTVKLISNLCSGIHALVAAEAFTLGAACGFEPARLLEVFAHTDAKSFFMTDYVAPRIARGDVQPVSRWSFSSRITGSRRRSGTSSASRWPSTRSRSRPGSACARRAAAATT